MNSVNAHNEYVEYSELNAVKNIATTGPVLVVGAGLLGTSIALALTNSGVSVQLEDISPTNLALAADMGAGAPYALPRDGSEPELVVVATPPDVAAQVVLAQLAAHPHATVTDVASIKTAISLQVHAQAGRAARRYVGSHPMAGKAHSGPGNADADLFIGRPWVIVAHDCELDAQLAVRNLAVDLGAVPVQMTAQAHDEAVAAVSHLPQLLSSLLAAQMIDLPQEALSLAGQGLRDTTRIAASDPKMWAAILAGNALPVLTLLRQVRSDLDRLIAGLCPATQCTDEVISTSPGFTAGVVGAIADVIGRGNIGQARIPGKHGGPARRYSVVQVLVPDHAGYLGKLFAEIGQLAVNIEDFAMEHSPGQSVGIATLYVNPASAQMLKNALEAKRWRVV